MPRVPATSSNRTELVSGPCTPPMSIANLLFTKTNKSSSHRTSRYSPPSYTNGMEISNVNPKLFPFPPFISLQPMPSSGKYWEETNAKTPLPSFVKVICFLIAGVSSANHRSKSTTDVNESLQFAPDKLSTGFFSLLSSSAPTQPVRSPLL